MFVLLIDGKVFKFWGSTDPKLKANTKLGSAFLVEGQHMFSFGWHCHSENLNFKTYQGLIPYSPKTRKGLGVLVYRQKDDALNDSDIQSGNAISDKSNSTINIHWGGSGVGGSGSWSKGCQVFASKSYINSEGTLINSKGAASVGSYHKNNSRNPNTLIPNIKETKGAYDIFTDLLLLYRPKEVDYLYYTLGRDETFDHEFIRNLEGSDLLAHTMKILPKDFV